MEIFDRSRITLHIIDSFCNKQREIVRASLFAFSPPIASRCPKKSREFCQDCLIVALLLLPVQIRNAFVK